MNRLFASLVCQVLLFSGGSAFAQRAALIEDRDAPGRAPYLQEIGVNPSNSICPNSFFCVITFPAVPAGRRLVITHASVEFTNGVASAGTAYVSGPSGIFGPRMIIPPGGVQGANRVIASGPITYYLEAGQTPTIIFSGNNIITSNSAFGMLAGYLVTLP